MTEYIKKWLSLDGQIQKLVSRGVAVPDLEEGKRLLRSVGYYRLTGYLYPFRESTVVTDDGRRRIHVENNYRAGTSIHQAMALIDFDRRLRMHVLEGVERIEVSLKMQIGYVVGKESAFAYLAPETFIGSFTQVNIDPETGEPSASKHAVWMERMSERQKGSDEAFVAHFRSKYQNKMPIWVLTEVMELGQASRLFSGLNRTLASEIAVSYGAPSKKVMASWISSLNYVRNVAAHHSRLFNRKLVSAPARPRQGQVILLDHLRAEATSKEVFGLYNALAVMAFMLRSIEPENSWAVSLVAIIKTFPEFTHLDTGSIGIPPGWTNLDLWKSAVAA